MGDQGTSGPGTPHHLVDHLFRNRAGQMVAWLARVFGPAHLDLAEEVVQDALVKALQQWPYSGIPDNPSGWLLTVARNGALDVLRRNASFAGRAHEIARELERATKGNDEDSTVEDDELRMIFMCCHPSLTPDARIALSLKTVGGFSVAEIASAFLTTDAAIAQRLVRAKRALRDNKVGLELPAGQELAQRLDSVLAVIYLLFNEGYSAHAGEQAVRQDLCGEAMRLGQIVTRSAHLARTRAPVAHALNALMSFQAARLPARVDENGELVLLEDQDRARWDHGLVARGFAHLERSAEGDEMSTYHVQASIAAVHAGAATPDETRWPAILALYDDLVALNPSPVVRLNRVVALSKVEGPAPALAALADIEREPALAHYSLLPAVKARLLAEVGDLQGAADAYRRALAEPCTEPERRFLLRRLAACGE